MTRSVDELRALGEISQAVSSSLDLDEVLTTIVTRAVQLSGTEGGSMFEFDQATRLFHVRTCFGTEPELVAALRATRIHLDETFVGRAAASGEPQSAPDLAAEPQDPHIELLASAGWRSMLVVPLRWEQEIIGALLVRRRATGAFSARTAELLETLASQSAVAIHNARVFRQLEEKSDQLEVAGRHKSEFLASMSHELRTPLNAVIGFSDVLLERLFGELNERQDEYVRDIRDSGRHLLELINEILDLSKVEAGRMELDPGRLALVPLLEHGLAMVRERADRTGISLELADGRRRRHRLGRRAQAQAGRPQPADERGEVHRRRRLGRRDRARATTRAPRSRSATRASGSATRTASGSSRRSSAAAATSGRRRRGPAWASRCRSASSSSTAAGCGSRASVGVGSLFGFSLPPPPVAAPTADRARGRRARSRRTAAARSS